MSILLKNISKRFGKQQILTDLSLEIEDGELFVLLGASGSGKSTLLRLIAGLTPLDRGSILLNGRDVTRLSPQKRDTGFVFQNYSLFRHLNVTRNIEFGLRVRGVPRHERQQRVAELLRLIQLEDLGKRMPWQLSGGQQQRVAVARALAPNPSVLLLDEPFGALDVKIRSQLRQNLHEIQKSLKVTSILVTHDQEEAFELADRIGIIDKGVLLEVGTPTQLYRRPQHPFTATFLGHANLLKARCNGKLVYLGEVGLPVPAEAGHLHNQPVNLLCRPEEIELATEQSQLQSHFIGQGRVQSLTFAGAMERATIQLSNTTTPQSLTVLLSPDRQRLQRFTPGQEVFVGIQDFHLMPLSNGQHESEAV